jgi:hypothetical protein
MDHCVRVGELENLFNPTPLPSKPSSPTRLLARNDPCHSLIPLERLHSTKAHVVREPEGLDQYTLMRETIGYCHDILGSLDAFLDAV